MALFHSQTQHHMINHFIIFISYFQTLNMLKPEKKSSSGTKRKASALMNNPNKDQESKRQKMTELGPKRSMPEPVKIIKKKSRFLKW